MSSARLPPGSLGLPVVGETLAFVKNPFLFFEDRYRRHGSVFKTRILGKNVACFVGPEAWSVFLDGKNFAREGASPPNLQELLNPGAVPFLDGAAHRVRKQLLLQAVGPKAAPGYAPLIARVVKRHATRWATQGGELTWARELGDLAFAVTDALFGGGDPEGIDRARQARFVRFLGGVFALPIKAPFTAYSGALQARDELLRDFTAAAVRRKQTPGEDVMTALLRAEVDGVRLSDEQVAYETLHLFFAAAGGLHALLCGVGHALTTDPGLRDRIRGEPQFVRRFVLEVKRFYPVVPITFFARALQPVTVGEHVIPQGWLALGATYSSLREERTFAQPNRFDPDRFAPGRAEHERHPHAFVPQGSGPAEGHRCAGEFLSGLILEIAATELSSGYDWTAPPQDLDFDLSRVPPTPKDGLRVVFKPRQAAP